MSKNNISNEKNNISNEKNKISNDNLINPYALFGINVNSKITDLKRAYYSMSLLCHPDKGGNEHQMDTVAKAYRYIKEQLENSNTRDKSYEELEEDFANFCKEQEAEIPQFSNIYTETFEWLEDFNKKFLEKHYTQDLGKSILPHNYEDFENNDYDYKSNPFDINNGYGDKMDNSEHSSREPTNVNIEYNPNEVKKSSHKFNKEIIVYEEPVAAPDYMDDKYPLDKKTITNFTGKGMIDYEEALSDPVEIKDNRKINSIDKVYDDFKLLQEKRDIDIKNWFSINK